MLYLVCTLFDYEDVRQLAMHRLKDVEMLGESARTPKDFDLDGYARGAGSAYNSRGMIRLVARFDAPAAEHLRETPLSADQTWVELENAEQVEVSATVEHDDRLRWWLLAFGAQVEVLKPPHLRRATREVHRKALSCEQERL